MRTSHRLRALLALVIVLVLALAACGDDDDDTDTAAGSDTTETTAAPTETTTAPAGDGDGGEDGAGSGITISGFRFQAPESVAPGATVEVSNTDSAPHTVTADDGAFDSGQIDGNGSGSFMAPSEPGAYAYHCEVHPNMKGELVVS